MKLMGCCKLLLSGYALLTMVGLGAQRVEAQAAPAPPTASLLRNSNLAQTVWPGDFNGDGITDLAASAPRTSPDSPSTVVIALGNGNGTFGPPISTGHAGSVAGVSDVNGDGRPDLLVVEENGTTALTILYGSGAATFPTSQSVSEPTGVVFARVADLDGDGVKDLIVGTGEDTIHVYPGRTDGTYGDPATLQGGLFIHDAILADFNGDGRKDLAVANHYGRSVTIFLNQGAFVFLASDVPTGMQANGVATGDFNGDGKADLVVAMSDGGDNDTYFTAGAAGVLLGHGDGTFGALARYDTPPGGWRAVTGDFNRDGVIDVALANRSSLAFDGCGRIWRTWDSLSILPGAGNGTFAAASTFSIGNQADLDGDADVDRVVSLNTSDVNGDHATDLIVSDGTVFLNRPPAANHAPQIDLRESFADDEIVALRVKVTDADNDMVTYRWTSSDGSDIPPVPRWCVTSWQRTPGPHTYTVTVDDGRGHQTSGSVTFTAGAPDPGPGGGADPWQQQDVGATSAGGGATRGDDGTLVVQGSGADIWGAADAFHFFHQPIALDCCDRSSGDTLEITTLVSAVQNVNAWTKAGVMIREGLDAGARHASLFVSPGKGIAFQRRTTAGGTSVSTSGPPVTAPVWLKLAFRDGTVTAYYRKSATDLWTVVGRQALPALANAEAGVAVTSHADGTLATARFSNLDIRDQPALTSADVGTTGGSTVTDGVVTSLTAKGADIWGTSDQFRFAYTSWSAGAGSVTARVRSVQNVHAWTKAGVMFREDVDATTMDAGGRYVFVMATPGKGVVMQYRAAAGAPAATVGATVDASAPGWLRLTRNGDTYTGDWSVDGVAWTTIGSVTVALDARRTHAGLALTSHSSTAATAAFDDVAIEQAR